LTCPLSSFNLCALLFVEDRFLMHFINYPMSALESPPSLSTAWSEPWAAAGQGIVDGHDFYKASFSSSSSPPMMGIAAAVSSSTHHHLALDPGNAVHRKRVVNFKLDIKREPEDACVPQMQKVPSLSDLSDPDSSLDLPAQVSRAPIRSFFRPLVFPKLKKTTQTDGVSQNV